MPASRSNRHPVLRPLLGLGLGLTLLLQDATASPLHLVDPYDSYGSTVIGAGGVIYHPQLVSYWGPGRLADYQLPVSSFAYGGAVARDNTREELTDRRPIAPEVSYGRAYVDLNQGIAGAELQRPITLSSSDAALLVSLNLLTSDLPSAFALNVSQAPNTFYSARTGVQIYSRQPGAQPGAQRNLLGTVIYADDDGNRRWAAERWHWEESSDPAWPGQPVPELIASGLGEFDFGTLAGLASSAVNGRTTEYFYEVFLHLSSWGICMDGNYDCEDASTRGALNAQLSFATDSAVPEPGSLPLAGAALLLMLGRRQLRQRWQRALPRG